MLENILLKDDSFSQGHVLGKRYLIDSKLGCGSIAEVYSAYDRRLRIMLALKIMRKKSSSDAEFVERFIREASVSVRLSHPNIVRVYDAGELEGRHFISMELIRGQTLDQKMALHANSEEGFPHRMACEIAKDSLSALIYAHQKGVVHRDIKPSNIMIDNEGHVKITDFGIVKIIFGDNELDKAKLTKDLSYLGTPQYMSPEHIRRDHVEGLSDVFSLGVVIYEMLTGSLPFGNTAMSEDPTKMLNILHEKLIIPRAYNPKIERSLQDIILKSLEKDKEKRYCAEELLQALEGYLNGDKIRVEGSFKRKFTLTRREFISNITRAALGTGMASMIVFGTKGDAMQKNIASIMYDIQQDEIDSLDKLKPLLAKLYPMLCERFEFIYDNEIALQKQPGPIMRESRVYPCSSISSGVERGRCSFLSGDSLTSGFIIPMYYYMFEELQGKQGQKDRAKLFLKNMLDYSAGIYFTQEGNDDNVSDEKELTMPRFYYPFEASSCLDKQFHQVFMAHSRHMKDIRAKFSDAIKMIIEKRFNQAKGYINWLGSNIASNENEVDAKRDSGVAISLCCGFRQLDLEKEVLLRVDRAASSISDVDKFITMIISDADMKIQKLIRSESWLTKAETNDYTELMLGFVYRTRLLEDILTIDRSSEGARIGARQGLLGEDADNFMRNISKISPELKKRIAAKKAEYGKIVDDMMAYFVSNNDPSMISRYFLARMPANPVNTIASLRLLEAITCYGKNYIKGISMDDIRFRILKSILSKDYLSYENTTHVSNRNPFGFINNTLLLLSRKKDYNGTYIESDYLLFKNIRNTIKRQK